MNLYTFCEYLVDFGEIYIKEYKKKVQMSKNVFLE